MAILGDFLGPAFAASRVLHISDLHSTVSYTHLTLPTIYSV